MGGRVMGRSLPRRESLLIAVGLLGCASGLGAQHTEEANPAGGGWTFSIGMARHGVSDALASPLRHRGTGFLLGAGYNALGANGGWRLAASFTGPRVASRIESARGGFEETLQADLGWVFLRPVGAVVRGQIRLQAGVAADVRATVREHHYDNPGWGPTTEVFGDGLVPLQASGAWSVGLGPRNRLSHRLSVPVVSVVFRSPYTGLKYAPRMAIVGPTTLTGFDSELAARLAFGRGRGFTAFHRMTLVKYPDPMPLAWVLHRFGVSLELGR